MKYTRKLAIDRRLEISDEPFILFSNVSLLNNYHEYIILTTLISQGQKIKNRLHNTIPQPCEQVTILCTKRFFVIFKIVF